MSGEFEDQVFSRAGDSTKQYDPTNCSSDYLNHGLLHITVWLTMCPLLKNFEYNKLHVYFTAGLAGRDDFSSKLTHLGL